MGVEQQDIHGYFGLTYANYLVLPRALLQSMPEAWQHRFTAMLDELHAAFPDIEWPDYKVDAGRWMYLGDLSEADMERLDITACEHGARDGHVCWPSECTYYDANGDEIDPHTASVFKPGTDPIPHYNRGRTHVRRADEKEQGAQ